MPGGIKQLKQHVQINLRKTGASRAPCYSSNTLEAAAAPAGFQRCGAWSNTAVKLWAGM